VRSLPNNPRQRRGRVIRAETLNGTARQAEAVGRIQVGQGGRQISLLGTPHAIPAGEGLAILFGKATSGIPAAGSADVTLYRDASMASLSTYTVKAHNGWGDPVPTNARCVLASYGGKIGVVTWECA
jgi:hypothetical protein